MTKRLGSSIFCYNAISQDYCLQESVECLKALSDEVVVLDCGSTDGTADLVKSLEDGKTKVICLPNEEWARMRGKEKLSHFSNIAKSCLTTEWHFCQQSDEVLHENCFAAVREAIERDEEAYFVERINLWGRSDYKLNVEPGRLPVGNRIIRLAKTKYFSVDDAEAIFAPASWDYISKIRIYHMGFVRNKKIHIEKIKHMQSKVFGMGVDPLLDQMHDGFDPWINFTKKDVVPISESLPTFVQQWAKERDEINQIIV